jgi:hypothetical protein
VEVRKRRRRRRRRFVAETTIHYTSFITHIVVQNRLSPLATR